VNDVKIHKKILPSRHIKMLGFCLVGVIVVACIITIIVQIKNAKEKGLLWTLTSGNEQYSVPAVANGVVYVGSTNSTLYAVKATTGIKKWSFQTDMHCASEVYTPTVANGRVFVDTECGTLFALDAMTGRQEWSFTGDTPTQPVTNSGFDIVYVPVVSDGMVYFGTEQGAVYALDEVTGTEKWVATYRCCGMPTLAVANGVIYVSAYGALHAVDALTGAPKWSFSPYFETTSLSAPMVANGRVYVSSEGVLYAVDTLIGTQIWSFSPNSKITSLSTLAGANGMVYVSSGEVLYAVDALTGTQIWSFSPDNWSKSTPTVVNGSIYFSTEVGELYSVNALTGAQEGVFIINDTPPCFGPRTETTPVVMNGVTYVVIFGNLYAIDLTTMTQTHQNNVSHVYLRNLEQAPDRFLHPGSHASPMKQDC
jgi:eukaryotic-like serine/threonine-protein kinase